MQTTEDKQIPLLNNGQPIDQKDILFVYFLAERLPIETRKTLKFSTPEKKPQRYDQLKKFLDEKSQALQSSHLRSTSIGNQQLDRR